MIKEAVKLNIKYLCKCGDYKDPYKYKGSGVYWRRIIQKHNPEIKTTILGKFETKEQLRAAGEKYSIEFDIVRDKTWANLIPEIGDGGPTTKNKRAIINPTTKEERFINADDPLPENFIYGRSSKRGLKSKDVIEKVRNFHKGRKRSALTRERMKNSKRSPRRTTECKICNKQFTFQNIQRHIRTHIK